MKSALKTLLLGLLVVTTQAAPFAVPTEAIPPFHRDRLPIDTDSISNLSAQLTMLAQGASLDSPQLRRATAQTLALALALDPENSTARSSLAEIAKGSSLGAPDDEKVLRTKARIWKMFDWLASPEAGADGNLLADLVGDASSMLDPGHPTAVSLRDSTERGKWGGWVAPLSSFSEKQPEPVRPLAAIKPIPPKQETDPSPRPSLKASTASIGAVLYGYDKAAEKYILRPTTVSMAASPYGESDEDRSGFRIDVSCPEGSEHKVRDDVSKPIRDALEKLHGSRLPAGVVRILTGSTGIYSHSRNGYDMTGPGFVLANAAVTGIAPGATIIATLDEDGKIALPDYFWSKLETLTDGKGGRLIVPAAAEGYLTAMLALEKPEFFLKYEVLIASSPAEAITLCAEVPDESHVAAFAKFKEIKDKCGTDPLGSYLANRFVRQRLAEITQAAPYHLSAKLLAIQGAGERPRVLEQKILAAKVFQAIDPIRQYSDLNLYELQPGTAKSMESTYETLRAQLDGLDRYTDIRDRDLVTRAKGLASDLRSMYRLIAGRGEMWEKYDKAAELHRAMATADRELRKELSKLTGDPLPENAEARERDRERRRMRSRDK